MYSTLSAEWKKRNGKTAVRYDLKKMFYSLNFGHSHCSQMPLFSRDSSRANNDIGGGHVSVPVGLAKKTGIMLKAYFY